MGKEQTFTEYLLYPRFCDNHFIWFGCIYININHKSIYSSYSCLLTLNSVIEIFSLIFQQKSIGYFI